MLVSHKLSYLPGISYPCMYIQGIPIYSHFVSSSYSVFIILNLLKQSNTFLIVCFYILERKQYFSNLNSSSKYMPTFPTSIPLHTFVELKSREDSIKKRWYSELEVLIIIIIILMVCLTAWIPLTLFLAIRSYWPSLWVGPVVGIQCLQSQYKILLVGLYWCVHM